MNKALSIFLVICGLLGILVVTGVFYTVDETKLAVITQFGELIGEPKTVAGLYFKLPWQQTTFFEKRILQWDGDADQIPTREKRFIWVDTTARWRIADPLKFMQSVGTEMSALSRLDDIIDASTRDIISSNNLVESIRNTNRLFDRNEVDDAEDNQSALRKTALEKIEFGRKILSKKILLRASKIVPEYGIELVDVKIKRINYVKDVRMKVYERMVSERKRAAEQFRSEGQGKKAEIEGQMTKELDQIRAEAYRRAQEIKGKADAESIKIYAQAYNKDPEFYSFLRSLESYKKTLNSDSTLILSTDNAFFEYLSSDSQKAQ